MKVNILCDAHWESRLDKVVGGLTLSGYRTLFEARDYGVGLRTVVVVLMCRNPALGFLPRIRHIRKKATLYADVMFDLDAMRVMTDEERWDAVCTRLSQELPSIIAALEVSGFAKDEFIADFQGWLTGLRRDGTA